MIVYCDESGDLGWVFSKPLGRGGSSRYLTIAFVLIPENLKHLPKRIVRKIYARRRPSAKIELKGYQLPLSDKKVFAQKVTTLLAKNSSIEIFAITVKKTNVQQHIREDPNKLYNYMIGLILLDKITSFAHVTLTPDKRSIKVESGKSLRDYLQIKLWFEYETLTTVESCPRESQQNLNLVFVDWIANIIWNHYENRKSIAFNIIKDNIELRELFFSSS